MENYTNKIIQLTKETWDELGKLVLDQFSHIWFIRQSSFIANKDLGKPRLVWAQPFHPYLISPRCQYSELAWHSPFKTTFISNTKWSRVVKCFLIFLIVDRSVSCWFLVCVLYFISLICSQLTPVAFTCIEGRGWGYPESHVLWVALMISPGVVCNANPRYPPFCGDASLGDWHGLKPSRLLYTLFL